MHITIDKVARITEAVVEIDRFARHRVYEHNGKSPRDRRLGIDAKMDVVFIILRGLRRTMRYVFYWRRTELWLVSSMICVWYRFGIRRCPCLDRTLDGGPAQKKIALKIAPEPRACGNVDEDAIAILRMDRDIGSSAILGCERQKSFWPVELVTNIGVTRQRALRTDAFVW